MCADYQYIIGITDNTFIVYMKTWRKYLPVFSLLTSLKEGLFLNRADDKQYSGVEVEYDKEGETK
jgi:hypothetical protein